MKKKREGLKEDGREGGSIFEELLTEETFRELERDREKLDDGFDFVFAPSTESDMKEGSIRGLEKIGRTSEIEIISLGIKDKTIVIKNVDLIGPSIVSDGKVKGCLIFRTLVFVFMNLCLPVVKKTNSSAVEKRSAKGKEGGIVRVWKSFVCEAVWIVEDHKLKAIELNEMTVEEGSERTAKEHISVSVENIRMSIGDEIEDSSLKVFGTKTIVGKRFDDITIRSRDIDDIGIGFDRVMKGSIVCEDVNRSCESRHHSQRSDAEISPELIKGV